jgi:hypothetical protein
MRGAETRGIIFDAAKRARSAPGAVFVTTHWSVVLTAGRSDSTHARAA